MSDEKRDTQREHEEAPEIADLSPERTEGDVKGGIIGVLHTGGVNLDASVPDYSGGDVAKTQISDGTSNTKY